MRLEVGLGNGWRGDETGCWRGAMRLARVCWAWMRTFLYRRAVHPLLDLLRLGATPEGLAWSLAVGLVIGVNPLLGSTTLLGLALAGVFRLNLVASQIGNHIVYPLQLALLLVWIRLGSLLFHTRGLPLSRKELVESVSHHPWQTTRMLWTWEWHALIVWAVVAVVAAPALKMLLVPAMRTLEKHLHHRALSG